MSNDRKTLPITGYFDRVSARPGGRLAAKINAEGGGTFRADVVRILCGDPNPAGPGLIYAPQDFGLAPEHPAREQAIDNGSYAVLPADPLFACDRLGFSVLIQPGLLRASPSVIAAALDGQGAGWVLELSDAALVLRHHGLDGNVAEARLDVALPRWVWQHLWCGIDREQGRLTLGVAAYPSGAALMAQTEAALGPLPDSLPLTLAARQTGGAFSAQHFNGRLEDPAFHTAPCVQAPPLAPEAGAGEIAAWWDFSVGIETQSILDRGPRGLAGRLVNVPTRAMRGARWSGAVMDWAKAPREYAAIHFHEDDLYDCGWDTDFVLQVPEGTPSGVYGLRLRKGGAEDVLPFYVLPARGAKRAPITFLASTFTHQAYANHARGNCDAGLRARMAEWGASPYNPDDYPVYGRSTYNYHPDGTGISISSRLRPCLTVRPGYLTFDDPRGSGLRHFSADTHLLYWLERQGIAFDVITDEDLDDEGPALLEGTRILLTGSHPEYHTGAMLDALQGFARDGGRFAYLGGNGFYWKITRQKTLPGVIELRRAEGGIRAWATAPGESHHQLDGGYGGLWRRNGRAPQSVGAVGFSAQGLFEGSYYRRTPRSFEPDVAWIFDGVTEERLGDYGLSGGGAAGFELDRADPHLGTPEGTVILARSEGHGAHFVTVPEELLSHIATVTGEAPADLVRAEIVYCPMPGGGAIFAAGSITFCGSLLHDDGRNGVSRMLRNVLDRWIGERGAA